MSLLDPDTDDLAIIANAQRLAKSGVRPSPPDSPDGRRLADAVARQQPNVIAPYVFKAQLDRGRAGSSSQLHDDTVRQALRRGDRGWTAVDRLTGSPGLTGGPGTPMGGRRAEFDPRNPLDPAYFDEEGHDQLERSLLASEMRRDGAAKALTLLKLTETARRNPLAAEAMRRAERKARKKGKKVTPKGFLKQLRKLDAKRGPVAKGAPGGLVGHVVDLRVPGRG